jgi:hypothetical protein
MGSEEPGRRPVGVLARAQEDAVWHRNRRKAAGDRHAAAQRNLFNRLIGVLFPCLAHGITYDEQQALPPVPFEELTAA